MLKAFLHVCSAAHVDVGVSDSVSRGGDGSGADDDGDEGVQGAPAVAACNSNSVSNNANLKKRNSERNTMTEQASRHSAIQHLFDCPGLLEPVQRRQLHSDAACMQSSVL